MKEPLVLYSTNTWLAYAVAERFYGGVHYAWCSPVYDGSKAASHVNIPPTSSPAEIYRALFSEVARGERHSSAIKNNRKGVKEGADHKLAAGAITAEQHKEILRVIRDAAVPDFRPVLYVIPYSGVRDAVTNVPIRQRAHPLSVEYRVERLSRDCFDMLELRI